MKYNWGELSIERGYNTYYIRTKQEIPLRWDLRNAVLTQEFDQLILRWPTVSFSWWDKFRTKDVVKIDISQLSHSVINDIIGALRRAIINHNAYPVA